MKKLVCAKDIEALGARGETVCYVDGDTIVTPSARDTAEERGIAFSEPMPVSGAAVPGAQEIDAGQVYQVLKALMERGLLEDIFKPFESERHENGLKVVRGGSVKMDVFETGTPGAKAFFQELVNKEESHISAGFLVIDHSEFPVGADLRGDRLRDRGHFDGDHRREEIYSPRGRRAVRPLRLQGDLGIAGQGADFLRHLSGQLGGFDVGGGKCRRWE